MRVVLGAFYLLAPASLMGLYKVGPFAYNGVLAFWLVAIDFFLWMVVIFRIVNREERRIETQSPV